MKRIRKWHVLIMLITLLCMIPLCAALATSGTVTASSLNMRAKASADSNVVGVLRQGDKVTIKETSGSWYKVTGRGKTGYVAKKYVSISSGSSSSSSSGKSTNNSSGSSNGTCGPGDKGNAVKKVQNRLIALGYLSGGADGDYGNMTKNAVKAFQSRNGLSATGTVNSATLNKLNSSSAKKAGSSSSNGTCGPGDSGDAVRKVQKRLIALGYLSGSADGDYGNMTKKAVIALQKKNGLSQTGTVNSNTLNKLNSSSAKKATASANGTERLDWFNGGKNIIPKGATFKVKDIWSGKVFSAKRWSGYNHVDAEPLSRSDTNIMKAIYGHWSWKRRPVLVKYNGHVYAASMNGMPHGTSTISNNGFDGHFCIHFYGSKTHGSQKVDLAHQNCVAIALNYSG